MRRGKRAEKRHEGAAGFGGERQAAQLDIARVAEPGHERMAARGAQRLLTSGMLVTVVGRPQGVTSN